MRARRHSRRIPGAWVPRHARGNADGLGAGPRSRWRAACCRLMRRGRAGNVDGIGTWSSGAAMSLALERRAFRFAELKAAATVLASISG